MQTVIKRNQTATPFNPLKITNALVQAGHASAQYTDKKAQEISSYVVKQLPQHTISVEAIQDKVEEALIHYGYIKTARKYIAYRYQHKLLRQDKQVFVEVISSVNEYLNKQDWRVHANANQDYSLGGLILNVSGKVCANYWLEHVYPSEIGALHKNADLHIHDLDMLAGYCAGWSLRQLLQEGFNGCNGKIAAKPPKHLSSAIGQMVNFLGTLQNEWAGAQAFSSFDTYLAPYVKKDKLSYQQIKQLMQEFIYNLNVPSRWGSQTPFTNVTFDWTVPDDLKAAIPVIANTEMPFTYADCEAEMALLNQAYIEVMTEGDANGRIFTFPIPTYNITKDFPWESENVQALFKMTAKYGLPYFQNFLNSDLTPNMVRSMCCRLQLDLRELLKRGNGLFGSAEQTGSIGVVTINCARLGYIYKDDKAGLYKRLAYLLGAAKNSLEIKRKLIMRYMDNGLFPYTKRYLGTLRNHFSTIGVNGINEMIVNFSHACHNIADDYGQEFSHEFLDFIRNKLQEFQSETGHMYNLEATPAEGTTYRLAKVDQKLFLGIIQAGTTEKPYYTNSSQLPVNYTDDPFIALSKQEKLQQKYTGGTVMHLYMNEALGSSQACGKLVKKCLTQFKIPYLTITPTFSICTAHGYISGEHTTCPDCGNACEVWTRVMGYHRPTSQFNPGKVAEFNDRTYYQNACS